MYWIPPENKNNPATWSSGDYGDFDDNDDKIRDYNLAKKIADKFGHV